MPKYPAIKAALKERLLGNDYADGHALPSEPQLAREFDVSRMTARRAIDELEREGYLYRVQGRGPSQQANVSSRVAFPSPLSPIGPRIRTNAPRCCARSCSPPHRRLRRS